ncbi:hypothetical protein [Opitutus terrae]|uniref:DUF3108 domain-containing protein n=1 Tax=Opitutus terrae (strain DSM 11246 / JCM 15787 / PB90-1) TaxID=452637 RepID=B1ZZ45_OPITP|nr:hypothetical protein [Opitutus terrae]ACB77117.1 hypothetical protein Oter_3843 [Opitutus terrae PB90-1]
MTRRCRHVPAWLLLAVVVVASVASVGASESPASTAAFREVLATFRTEGPRGWSFTQTTEGAGHRRVERFDAAQPEFLRWTLVQEDGRTPTADETRDYQEKLSRRSRGGTGPQFASQLDVNTMEFVGSADERATYRLRVQPGETGDATAQFLRATIVFHEPTRTIESLEIASVAPFSPTFGVKIAEMKTTLRYSLPTAERPSLLQQSVTRLRGRAFWLKSLDADLTVVFSGYEYPFPRPRTAQ